MEYTEGESESYLLPLGSAWGEEAERVAATAPTAVLAQTQNPVTAEKGVLYDASQDRTVAIALFDLMVRRRRFSGTLGELTGWVVPEVAEAAADLLETLTVTAPRADETSHSIVFGDSWILTFVPARRDRHQPGPGNGAVSRRRRTMLRARAGACRGA